ncbi:hypothetical protein KORDIASMS9_00494 [Kordia sp. SMS9]|uniref:DUF6705 family protein n=1 Tax=Kordia sp. SMS9 TaxID=2282170 RepID=UPI000E0D6A2D|nr:DUF6705 family protein [Kordia sp. SMS9]AXG68300.1 hypothetical protein KORDIASMS9_00494 [Kordia sp. SMS9]
MKKVIFLIFMACISLTYAQEDQIISIHQLGSHDNLDSNKSYYFKDINRDLDKFLGTWHYDDGNKKLTLVFSKQTHFSIGKHYCDQIYARFKYEENGTVIYNTLGDFSNSARLKIVGSGFDLSNLNKMNLFYNEPTTVIYDRISTKSLKPSPSLDIEYLPCSTIGCNPQLKWNIIYYKEVGNTAPNPFKIPFDLTLTKQ